MPHDTEGPSADENLARSFASLAADHDVLLRLVADVMQALQSGAIFDWYQRDALIRRMLAHVEKKR